jgi:hypothetical protein
MRISSSLSLVLSDDFKNSLYGFQIGAPGWQKRDFLLAEDERDFVRIP